MNDTHTIPCWGEDCDGVMSRFADDTFYWYYRCPKCGREKLEPKEEPKEDQLNLPEVQAE